MIPEKIAKKVLLVGPDYKNHRGGIGAMIGIHKGQYEVFNFIPSFRAFNNNTQKSLFFVGQLCKIIYFLSSNKDIKLVHIHSSKQGSLYRKLLIAFIAKQVFGKKTINHIHTGNFKRFYDSSNWLGKKMIRTFLEMNDVTITVSDSWKNYFNASFNLKNVYKINNMVEITRGNTVTAIDRGPVNLLYLGLVNKHKGIFDLVKVLADNQELLKNKVKLTIGGNGQIGELNEFINGNDLNELVEYKGWVTGEEKQKLIQATDIFILPSYYEGLPVSILEAMSYGKPVIATSVGGIPEVVEQGVNGILVPPGDYVALLNALLYYINEPGNISRHGDNSLNRIKDYYPEVIIPQLETIYNSLLS
jgi:glycosyltransferase involved in cell wall biosynthesis